jgi:hypothetical protein
MKNKPLFLCLALLLVTLLPILPRPVLAASCSDIQWQYPFKQLYLPASIELDYPYTKSADANAVPYGHATGFTVSKSPISTIITISENDTYHIYFNNYYDSYTIGNASLVIKEGDRQPEPMIFQFCGNSIYIEFKIVQVIQQPKVSYSLEDFANYLSGNVLQSWFSSITTGEQTVIMQQTYIFVLIAVLFLLQLVQVVQTRRLGKKIKGEM